MRLQSKTPDNLLDYFNSHNLLPASASQYLQDMGNDGFVFYDQLQAAESIHLHIKVADTNNLPHDDIVNKGGIPQNGKRVILNMLFSMD